MVPGLRVEFTVVRERARRDALLRRATRATPASPALVLCPDASVARAIERQLAEAGGAFASVFDWEQLLDALEWAAGLARTEVPHEASRVAWIEAALEARRGEDPSLESALSVDPHAVAKALVRAVDFVRAAGWQGDEPVIDRACAALDPAVAVAVRAHLSLVALGAKAIESGLAESATLDRTARLARWVASDRKRAPRAWKDLVVEGVDLLAPIERSALEALARCGVRVEVAPWVYGWTRPAPRPADDPEPPASALEALARFPMGDRAASDDGSIVECAARDQDEEADAVAEWIASLPEDARTSVAIAVPGDAGDGPRVLRALARHGVRGAFRGAISATSVPLWNVLRAVVRLAWRGPDALDLATVLTAPGSGTWGADRDRICARLRTRRPARWPDVRAVVVECTDPSQHGLVLSDEPKSDRAIDPARAAALEEQRRTVLALLSELEGDAALKELAPSERVHRLRAVIHGALNRFANPKRIQASVDDPRAAGWWVGAASAIREATRAVLDAVERDPRPLGGADPAAFLLRVERMLPSLSDAVDDRRADRVRVLAEGSLPEQRPRTLVVLGFAQGRYPRGASATPWLGPTERRALSSVTELPALSELPDEGLFAQIALRNAHRLLASPTESLVLVRPHRGPDGGSLEPCATRADVLEALPEALAESRARAALAHVRAALAPRSPIASSARRQLSRVVGAGLDGGALEALARHLEDAPEDYPLFSARLSPSRDFAIAGVLAPLLAGATYSPSDLELSTKCRFAFATRSVLGLRWLSLGTAEPWGPRALLGAAQRAVRALDADPSDVDRAVNSAIEAEDSHAPTLDTAGARRVLRAFVRRFGAQRKRWKAAELTPPDATATDSPADSSSRAPDATPVTIELPCEHPLAPRTLSVRGDVARFERVEDNGSARHLVVDLRLGRVDGDDKRRALGVGASSAVLPAVAAARFGVVADGLATVSLNRSDTALLAIDGAFCSTDAGDPRASSDSLTAVAREAKQRFSVVFDAIAEGLEPVAPHDHARRDALVEAGIRSCEGCPSRLLCRFDLPGETQ